MCVPIFCGGNGLRARQPKKQLPQYDAMEALQQFVGLNMMFSSLVEITCIYFLLLGQSFDSNLFIITFLLELPTFAVLV